MIRTKSLIILLCTLAAVLGQVEIDDIALVIGGQAGGSNQGDFFVGEHLRSIYPYTGHLGEDYQLCDYKGLDQFPVKASAMASVYLPDYGIFVCGGNGPDGNIKHCFYNNLEDAAHNWNIMDLPETFIENGVYNSALLTYTSATKGEGLWLIGGTWNDFEYYTSSYLYFPSDGLDARWTEFIEFPGEDVPAAVKLDISSIRNVNQDFYIINMFPNMYACFCSQDVTPCQDDEFICDIQQNGFSVESDGATKATVQDFGGASVEAAIIKSGGSGSDYMVYPRNFVDGKPSYNFMTTDLYFNFYGGAMANLMGRAAHLGGKAEPGGPVRSNVFMMQSDLSWYPEGSIDRGRYKPAVVIVPETWLCQ